MQVLTHQNDRFSVNFFYHPILDSDSLSANLIMEIF